MLHVLILASIFDVGSSASTPSAATVPELALFQAGQASRNSDVLAFVEEMVQGTVGRARDHNWTMTKEEKKAIEHAKQVIREMVGTAIVQHAEDQAETDRARDLIENCSLLTKAHLETSLGGMKRATDQSREEHSTCRVREVFLFGEWDRICLVYNKYRQDNSSALLPDCATGVALSDQYTETDDVDELKIFEECLVEMNRWIDPLYDPYYLDCQQAQEEAANSTARCNIKQRHFESGFCDYVVRLEDVCSYQEECRSMTINSRNLTHHSVRISVSARKSDHTAASKILCLFDVLDIEDPDDKKRLLHECDSRNHSVDNALFHIDYHDIPPPYPCDASATRPGDVNWKPEAYGNESWFGKIDLIEPEACFKDIPADLGDESPSLGFEDDVPVNDPVHVNDSGAVLLTVDFDARILQRSSHARIKAEIAKWHDSKDLEKGHRLAARRMALLGLGTHGKFKAEQVHHNKERAVYQRIQSEIASTAVLNDTKPHHASHIPRNAVRV